MLGTQVASLLAIGMAYIQEKYKGNNDQHLVERSKARCFFSAMFFKHLVNEVLIDVMLEKYKQTFGSVEGLQERVYRHALTILLFCDSLEWMLLKIIICRILEKDTCWYLIGACRLNLHTLHEDQAS